MKRPTPSNDDGNDGSSKPTTVASKRKLRLLLHAIDGCVPFLTPKVLERHFPPSDDLWIGMAVRDTCVLPTFIDNKPAKNKTKNSSAASDNSGGTKPNSTNKQGRDPRKPRGYTFAAVAPDSWLLPYTRVTVPSFDWMQDNTRMKKAKDQRPSEGSTSTNKHVLVWTPHGRQKLTAESYAQASSGLRSNFTLSLYDMPEEANNPKRLEKADFRNKEWFQDLLKRRSEEETAYDDSLWSPILLPTKEESSSASSTTKPLLTMCHDSVEDVAGVALIGQLRSDLGEALRNQLADIPHVAMMTTSSLSDILEIVSSGAIDTIGTELPTLWAKQKVAFAVDWMRIPNDRAKRPKLDPDVVERTTVSLNDNGCMDMSDKAYARDPKPLVPGCQCLACADDKFSRAYVHHLICAKELLADVLLFGHNLHHLLELIRAFNSIDDPQPLLDCIANQLTGSKQADKV